MTAGGLPKGARPLWQEFAVPCRFPVHFTREVFSPQNEVLADVMRSPSGPAAVFPVVDAGVACAHPLLGERLRGYAASRPEALTLVSPLHILPGGEKCKQGSGQVEKLYNLFLEHNLCRHAVVLAIGGGAFLDVAGFAAATAHRGIRLVRMPTTTLAQNDSGVGVKNGYNAFGRKNWVGSFTPPFAVVNDFDFLQSLTPRQRRSGLAEAVKVAVLKDPRFFRFLCTASRGLAGFCRRAEEAMIVRCAQLHMQHTAGADPFEQGSARPLDFGHWSAHAMEEWSGGAILHGEAVAVGMALDSCYAAEKGLLLPSEKEQILRLLRGLGFRLSHPALGYLDLRESLERFRQHLGGAPTITLPFGLGRSIEVHEMDLPLLHRCREWLLSLPENGEPQHGRKLPAVGSTNAGTRFPGLSVPTT